MKIYIKAGKLGKTKLKKKDHYALVASVALPCQSELKVQKLLLFLNYHGNLV